MSIEFADLKRMKNNEKKTITIIINFVGVGDYDIFRIKRK
jgi:hypothetical protein